MDVLELFMNKVKRFWEEKRREIDLCTVEELYLQTFHTNPAKILFFAYHASVACTV